MSNAEPTYDDLMTIACGHSAFQLLCAGVELGLFDLLSRRPGLSEGRVADELALSPRPARILLMGLKTLRLIRREADGLVNSAAVEQTLVRDQPGNMVDAVGWQRHIVYPAEVDFVESLKQNTNVGLRHFPGDEDNLYDRLAHAPQLEQVFHRAMSSISSSANRMLIEHLDLTDVKHLMDAGGGDGTNAMELARAFPQLNVTLFDRPSVCEHAQANIATEGMTHRVRTWPGDLFSDALPRELDAVLLAHLLTIWSLERNTELLRRVYDALPRGGRVIVFNMMAEDDGSGPVSAALGSPYFLTIATGEGMLYSWAEHQACLREAGFQSIQRHRLPRDHGLMIGIKQATR